MKSWVINLDFVSVFLLTFRFIHQDCSLPKYLMYLKLYFYHQNDCVFVLCTLFHVSHESTQVIKLMIE